MISEGDKERVVHDCGMFVSIWQCWPRKGQGQGYPLVCNLCTQLWFLYINWLLRNISVCIACICCQHADVWECNSLIILLLLCPDIQGYFLCSNTAQSRILLCRHMRKKSWRGSQYPSQYCGLRIFLFLCFSCWTLVCNKPQNCPQPRSIKD